MNILTLLLLAIALSADAFAVSISLGLSIKPLKRFYILFSSAMFGLFQGFMPLLGYLSSITLKNIVEKYSSWIAFILLFIIGAKMIYETIKEMKSKEEPQDAKFSFKNIFILAIATSIDAFASGISLAMLNVNILIATSFIAIITFALCICGFYFGKEIGEVFKHKAQILGGLVLIAIAFKSLIG
ncbi:MAG: manganese efflux pump [Clostridiales bacterium]|nr:manganese efflux pump [Clostridiales bacterium]